LDSRRQLPRPRFTSRRREKRQQNSGRSGGRRTLRTRTLARVTLGSVMIEMERCPRWRPQFGSHSPGGTSRNRISKRSSSFPSLGRRRVKGVYGGYLSHELKKQAVFEKPYEALPNIRDFHESASQTFNAGDFSTSKYFDRRNTLWTWYEISKAVTNSKFKLAESRSYKDIEQGLASPLAGKEELYSLHTLKMDSFHLAMYQLTRIQDLLLRLIFENLGASVIRVDLRKPNWERSVVWDKMMDGLKKRRGRKRGKNWRVRAREWIAEFLGLLETNPEVEALTDEEYDRLLQILRDFRGPRFVAQFICYRDRVTHGFLPSVDYPELYFSIEDRVGTPIRDSKGNRKGTMWEIGGMPANAEFVFLELYDSTAKTFGYWLGLLRKLKSIPRFGPTAVR